jgi:predicted transglutaminase-like cysteine proteinase
MSRQKKDKNGSDRQGSIMFRKFAIAVAALAAMATSAEAINLGAARSAKPQASRTVAAPAGYQIFCIRNQSECRGGGASKVAYTSGTAALLRRVNDAVNNSIRYRSERAERWNVGGNAGDCEDFALTKRSRLIRAGIPAGALRLATARTSRGELHAVLIVKTDKGDYVLDNIRKSIVLRGQSGYRYLKVATSNPKVWQPARAGREI